MARFEFTTPSGNSSYEITDEFVTIGSDAGNHLRVNDPSVAPVHLRLIHVQNGYRLELANAEQKVKVNGEECVARALKPNDRIQIGDTTLTFVDERAASPAPPQPQPQRKPQPQAPQTAHAAAPQQPRRAAPAAAGSAPAHRTAGHHAAGHHAAGHHAGHHAAGHHAAEHHAGGHHGHHKRKEKRPAWINWVMWGTLSFVGLLVALRLLGAGEYYREQGSPQHWLETARTQLAQGEFSRALDSCKSAEMREPDAETLRHIQELREQINARIARDKDQSNLTLAKNSLTAMEEFERTHLGIDQPRPAARELARNAQLWLKNYKDVVSRYPDAAADVAKVQSLYNRFAPIAQLEKPDDADDVLFAVDRFLALRPPLYREALMTIDGYLAAHPNDKRGPKLRERRDVIERDIVAAEKGK
ncbi:MAG TPA: FHA domain-containing protein [Planctomycetota bacterium]|nr:FHA domain-containing protein [Planctomycetota bacterium]